MKSFVFCALLALVAISLAQVGRAEEEDQALESSGRELNTFSGRRYVTFCDQGCGSGYYCKSYSNKYCGYKKVCGRSKGKQCLYYKNYVSYGRVIKKCARYGYKWVTKCKHVYDCGYKVCAKGHGFGRKKFNKRSFLKVKKHYG